MGFWSISRVGGLATMRFLWKHKYLVMVLIAILPSIISAISISKETGNISYPFMVLGMTLANADETIHKDVQILEENPAELIGIEKPTIGIWAKFKYWAWYIPKTIWLFAGSIFLISVPFLFFYKLFRLKQTSEPAKNIFLAGIFALIFIFTINLIVLVHGLITGSVIMDLPEQVGFYQETWWIIKSTLPFHGVASLGKYLFTLI